MRRAKAALIAAVAALAWTAAAPSVEAAPKKAKKTEAKKADEKKDDKKKPAAPLQRPGDVKASTKGLEEALKKTEEAEPKYRLAPAKLPDQGKEVSKDRLADKRRDEAIEQIKKLLPKQQNPQTKAELLFQLAELWWEKSKFVNLAEEYPAFEHEMTNWHKCRMEKGEKACGLEPRPNTRKSELYRKNAVELYAQIVKDYRAYRRLDEVIYALAFNKYELVAGDGKERCTKKMDDAVSPFRDLITQFPKSPLVCDAYVQLGNYYFDCNKLEPARKAFEAGAGANCAKTTTYSTYKLAWCDYNSGDYDAAISRFKTVVARSDKEGGERIKLKTEALRDMVLSFEKIGAVDAAIRYFQEKAGAKGSMQYIKGLAGLYFSSGSYDTAIKMYRWMIDNNKLDPNAPEWQSKIVLSFDKLTKRDEVLKEMRVLVDNYGRKSAWWAANKPKEGQKAGYDPTQMALALTEEALYNLVTDYHQEAIKTKMVATYRLAEKIYREYVTSFPESERAYQMRYYWAEILYALEEFQTAYEQYLVVAQDKERDDYKRVSASNMLLAAEKLVDLEAGRAQRTIDSESKKIDEKKDKGAIQATKIAVKIDKDAKEQPLTDMEKQLVLACDNYTEIVPNAEDEARVRLRAAVIYFDRIQYVEAAGRFGYIIKKWPENETSAKAALLIMESLEVKQEWLALNKLARDFVSNPKLLQSKKDLKDKLAAYIENSQFKYVYEKIFTEAKDYPTAARMFREFVTEFPKSPYSPIALYNAFVVFQKANELDTAIAVGEQLLKEYGNCDTAEGRKMPDGSQRADLILPLLVFDLAKTYEKTADFATASRYYEKFAADHSGDVKALDAQFNAGLWYQAMGEHDRAIAAFEKYMKSYKEKKAKLAEIEKELKGKVVPEPAVFFTIGLIHESRKDWKKAADQFDAYMKTYPSEEGWKQQNARYKRMLALREMGKAQDAADICKAIVEKNDKGFAEADKSKETSKLAAAHCRFMGLESSFDAFTKMGFGLRTLKNDLALKIKKMGELKADYTRVVADGNGDWAIAALVRIAMLPKNFAKSLLEAPMPKGLDADQQDMYRAALEEEALKYEEPAVAALEVAIAKSFELAIYNEWTLEAEKMLGEFKPDLFTEIRELAPKGSEFFFTTDPVQAAQVAEAQ